MGMEPKTSIKHLMKIWRWNAEALFSTRWPAVIKFINPSWDPTGMRESIQSKPLMLFILSLFMNPNFATAN
jgi:hypothetical protein